MTVSYKKSANGDYYTACMTDEEGKVKGVDDYYTGGSKEPPGTWFVYSRDGSQEIWGIKNGQVFGATPEGHDVERFQALVKGYNPDGGESLVKRMIDKTTGKEKARVGLHDFTYSAPKSVSVVWSQLDDDDRELIEADNLKSAGDAHRFFAGKLEARTGAGGKEKSPVAAVAGALFGHGSSREDDPQLHVHSIFANACLRADGGTGALELSNALKWQGAAASLYHASLAWSLRQRGFEIERKGKIFEIKGVPEKAMEGMSNSRKRILNALDMINAGFKRDDVKTALTLLRDVRNLAARQDLDAEQRSALLMQEGLARGLTAEQIEKIEEIAAKDTSNAEARGYTRDQINSMRGLVGSLARETRDQKNELSRFQLVKLWNERGAELGFTKDDVAQLLKDAEALREISDEELMEEARAAVLEIHETDAVFTDPSLMTAVLTRMVGQASPERLMTAVERLKVEHLLKAESLDAKGNLQTVYTTRYMVALEQQMMQLVSQRDGRHVLRDFAVDPRLKDEQKAALLATVYDENAVTVIEGTAGAGKTFTMNAIASIYRDKGYEVHGLATGWKAAKNLQTEAVLERGRALEGWIRQAKSGEIVLNDKTLLILDEAGMVGSKHMKEVLELVNQYGCKLILTGDTLQQKAVAAGDPLRHIVRAIGSSRLEAINRQKREEDRWAVKAFFAGKEGREDNPSQNTAAGLKIYADRGDIKIMDNGEQLHKAMIADWMKSRSDHVESARQTLELAAKGEVTDEKVISAAERVLSSFNQEHLMIANDNKSVAELNAMAHEARMEAGELGTKFLMLETLDVIGKDQPLQHVFVGDVLVMRKNNKVQTETEEEMVANRQLAIVRDIVDGKLHLETEAGVHLVMDPSDSRWHDRETGRLAIQYGYCMTSYSSQGVTVDITLHKESLASNRASAGVAMSRHREACRTYVDKTSHYDAWLSRQPSENWKPMGEFENEEVLESMAFHWAREPKKDCTLDFQEWRTASGAVVIGKQEAEIAKIHEARESAAREVARIQAQSKIPAAPLLKKLHFQSSLEYAMANPVRPSDELLTKALEEVRKHNITDKAFVGATQGIDARTLSIDPSGERRWYARRGDGAVVAEYDDHGRQLQGKPLAERFPVILPGSKDRVDIVESGLDALKLRSIQERDALEPSTIVISHGQDEKLGMPHVRELIEQAQEVHRYDKPVEQEQQARHEEIVRVEIEKKEPERKELQIEPADVAVMEREVKTEEKKDEKVQHHPRQLIDQENDRSAEMARKAAEEAARQAEAARAR